MTIDKHANEIGHDHWFRHQVAVALERVASGKAQLIPHDEFWDEVESYASELTRLRSTSVK